MSTIDLTKKEETENKKVVLPIDIQLLQPKVDKLNELNKEKKPKTIIESYELIKEIGFTYDELIWLCCSANESASNSMTFVSTMVKMGSELLATGRIKS